MLSVNFQTFQKYSIFSKIHNTKLKITLGKALYIIIVKLFGINTNKKMVRSGIQYQVDLSEGIDLSLYFFGNFQRHILQNNLFTLPQNAISLDIGANFGIISLQIAQKTPVGHVYAFEPTHYAFKKLTKNLALNSTLSKRITTIQSFVLDKSQKNPKITAYSSWKVGGNLRSKDQHPVHLGTSESTYNVKTVSIDDFCKQKKIKKIDFIKIDTDGYEYEILQGAIKTISKYKPIIIFEVGDYLLSERNRSFECFISLFSKIPSYRLFNAQSKSLITKANYRLFIPKFSTIDIIAIP